jgi:hypothetical protein
VELVHAPGAWRRVAGAIVADFGDWREAVVSRARELEEELDRVPTPGPDARPLFIATRWSVLGRVADAYEMAGISTARGRLQQEMRGVDQMSSDEMATATVVYLRKEGVDEHSAVSIATAAGARETWTVLITKSEQIPQQASKR